MAHADIERQLRKHLQAVVVRLGASAAPGANDATADRTPTRGDWFEHAQLVEARESRQLTRERLARQAKGLVLALERVKSGSYGLCIDCNDMIAPARLRAIPSATRCLACQQQFEKQPR